jgi:hypothetical protein
VVPSGRKAAGDLTSRRRKVSWYRHKHHVLIEDMLIAFRCARIATITAAQNTPELFGHGAVTYETTAE